MKSFRTEDYKKLYENLNSRIKSVADRAFEFWKHDTTHGSLNFECIDKAEDIWSVRIGRHYRALCKKTPDAYIWFWIGTHEEYNGLL